MNAKTHRFHGALSATQACKPGSVLTAIYLAPQLLTGSSRLLGTGGRPIRSSTALLRDRVYIVKPMLPWAAWALTPRFQPYPRRGGISLLHLSWGFPRRALPVIPALWSPDFPHPLPFGMRPRLSGLVAEILYSIGGQLSNVLQNLLGQSILIRNRFSTNPLALPLGVALRAANQNIHGCRWQPYQNV